MSNIPKDLVRIARAAGVCVSPVSDQPAFVVIHSLGLFYTPQTLKGLEDLLEFLKPYGQDKVIGTEYVTLKSELHLLGRTDRIRWSHFTQIDPKINLAGGYVYMYQWMQYERTKDSPKIVKGYYTGGSAVRTRFGLYKIVKEDGTPATFLSLLAIRFPFFVVKGMIDYPL